MRITRHDEYRLLETRRHVPLTGLVLSMLGLIVQGRQQPTDAAHGHEQARPQACGCAADLPTLLVVDMVALLGGGPNRS